MEEKRTKQKMPTELNVKSDQENNSIDKGDQICCIIG